MVLRCETGAGTYVTSARPGGPAVAENARPAGLLPGNYFCRL